MLLGVASSSLAAPVNLYTFNDGTANDSIGGQHGTVVDAGAVTASYFTNGNQRHLDLRGNLGQSSNGITNDAFIDLPTAFSALRPAEEYPAR